MLFAIGHMKRESDQIPFTAFAASKVVESELACTAVSVNDVWKTLTLTRHLRALCLAVYCTVRRTRARCRGGTINKL